MTHAKNRGRRILSAVLAFIMILALLPTAALAAVDNSYAAGTYTGKATGYGGTVSVEVTLEKKGDSTEITQILATGADETPSYWNKAQSILDTIKNQNGTDGLTQKLENGEIDVTSGATISAKAIVSATEKALNKAVSGFVGGDGSEEKPYQIASEAGLRYLQEQVAAGTSYAEKYVVLTSDITLNGDWTPIGKDNKNMFAGSFDGKGHTIKGMTIQDNSLQYIGLFGAVKRGTSIRNVNLTDVSIEITETEQNTYAGALVGYGQNANSTVSTILDNCTAAGSIKVSTVNKVAGVGGLMGFSDQCAAVTNCGANVDVTVDSGTGRATVGGLVGWTSIKGLFMNDYSLGNVSVTTECDKYDNIGAMFGQLNGIVYNCYTVGTSTLNSSAAPNPAGAFAGQIAAAAYLDNCYYVKSEVSMCSDIKGKYNKDTLLSKTAEELSSEEFAQLLHNNLSSSAIAAMQENVAAAEITDCKDFSALTKRVDDRFYDWALEDGIVSLTDELWTSGIIDSSIFASGTGTEEDPYLIATEQQLRNFAGSLTNKVDYSGVYIALKNDIALSNAQWSPIGGSEYLFNGTFDGAGHTISGMTMGTENEPYKMDKDNIYVGMFGIVGPESVVKNVHLTDVSFYSSYEATGYVGGIAGAMQGSTAGGNYTGAVIDSCSVSGNISHTATKGNQLIGGLVGMQYKGAVINSISEVKLSCVVTSGDLAEAGGLVGLNNRGLVANSYSRSTVYGSGNRENGNEGMAVVSQLIACNAGSLVNCYGSGNITTQEHSVYAGMVSGWITGIGKSYTCWYDLDSIMKLKAGDSKPQIVDPVESVGTKIASGVNEAGDAYIGGLVDKITGYSAAGYAAIANNLTGTFAAFPIDITTYGLSAKALKNWTYDASGNLVTFADSYGTVNYVQPECEKYTAPETALQNGTWYGRDDDKTTVVQITVADHAVTKTKVLSGSESGAAYDAALEKAKYKATYGDFSHYEAADPSQFAGGSGTASDPYQIANETQLRYLASSVNADVNWSGVYFKQTADITLTNKDWTPIGWALNGEVNGKKTSIGTYPFRGSYNGGGYSITGLTVGTEKTPADQMTTGLFGLVSGSYSSNEKPDGTEQVVELSNINLRDVDIHVSTRYETYTGGLVGQAQNGIHIDGCSVTGQIDAATSESFTRGGGLAGNVLRGSVTNSWADVDVNAVTDAGHVYAGGLYGMDNRVTTINCYALGDVNGSSTNNNKTHVGGLVGQAGAVHVNCYAAGNVVSQKPTTDAGILNGRSAGINVDINCYYNTEAVLKQGDTTVSPAVANGVEVNSVEQNVVGKTAAELASKEFAELLSSNAVSPAKDEAIDAVNAAITNSVSGLVQQNYYRGNDLLRWTLRDGVVTFDVSSSAFSDVSADAYYADAVQWAVENGITTGISDTVFAPDTSCTRAQAVTFLWRAAGSPAPKSADMSFTDVPANEYYYNAVLWAVENGIASGTSDTTFSPNEICSRAQIVTFLWRSKGSPAAKGSNPFSDVENNSYYAQAVLWAVEKNITAGTSDTTFSPDGDCSRAQIVTFLWRSKDIAAEESTGFTDVEKGAYYADAVQWAVQNKITTGTSDTAFSPDVSCTRAQAVTFLWRAAGSPAPKSADMSFTDVPANEYYYNAVLWAVENGITSGTSDTTFGPNEICSRAQIVTFLWRGKGSPSVDTANSFSDVAAGSYYEKAVQWAVANNITAGTTNETFQPDSDCTRGQIVTFLYRSAS